MDDASNIGNFELLLKNNTGVIRPSALYKSSTDTYKTIIKPQDVLHSVYSQIKTIQMADGKSAKFVGKEMNKVKSSFLAVNKLPLYNEVPKQINAFETQFVSDTQLINIIEDAEALTDTHKGMMQEFDTVLSHANKENKGTLTFTQKIGRENMPETQEFETSFTQTNVDKTVSFLEDKVDKEGSSPCADIVHTRLEQKETAVDEHNLKNVNKLKEICEKVLHDYQPKMVHSDKQSIESLEDDSCYHRIHCDNVLKHTEKDKENKTFDLGNKMKPIDSIDIDKDEDKSPSPILKIKNKTIPPPIVVSLESFERFERIAIPLISSSNDFDTCKHLINSQILEGKLCLNTDEDVIFNENAQLSPIIEKKCEAVQDVTEESIKTSVANLDNMNTRDKQSNSFKDEILFSSDEENDFIYREFQNMPLTAALDTSFGDHSNVLDETMYVCFQTASNKSIEIPTDLFQNAIDEDDNINSKDFSLAALVNICDQKSFNNVSSAGFEVQEELYSGAKSVVNADSDMTQAELKESNSNKDEEIIEDVRIKVPTVIDYNDTVRKPPEKQCFVGFMTASNRKINLSVMAFDHGKKVFKDIDFDKKFDLMNQDSLVTMTEDDKIAQPNNNEVVNDIDDKINDDMLIQEFENIEMSLEEKEKSYDDNNSGYFQSSKKDDASDGMKAIIKHAFHDIDFRKINDISEELFSVNKKVPEKPQIETIEREGNSESKTLVGFKTANNRNIDISAQALANTKIIFQDLGKAVKNKAADTSQPSTRKAAFLGFKTANNRIINISEIALSKTSKIFNEINTEDTNSFENEVKMAKSLFDDFKTASNKGVDIYKQALLKNNREFQDMEGNTEIVREPPNNFKGNASFSDFNEPNDKTVVESEKCNIKSKKLIECAKESPNTNDHPPSNDKPKYHIPTFEGFQTASKKPVRVSANALKKSKRIFQDIDKDELKNQLNTTSEGKFKVIQTTSNKEVKVAKEAIGASKKLLYELKLDETGPFTGFKTSSNKSVKLSKEAISKRKKIFDDISDEPAEKFTTKEVLNRPFRFQTSNNIQVEVSKDSLENKKNLFNDLEMPEILEQGTFKGFQTASKKKVVVSKDAIEKSKALFDDIKETTLREPFIGFKTANKKKVEISKEDIEKTKQLLHDLEVPIKDHEIFKGFQTASKKVVHVSEQALAKTKQIFNDINTHAQEVTGNMDSEKREGEQINKGMFSIQTGNNKNIDVSEAALKLSKTLFENSNDIYNKNKSSADDLNHDKTKKSVQKEFESSKAGNLSSIINTQVLNNFEESLCTEGFKEMPRSKRSGSPILSCPKAKRRKKFETPYKDEKGKKIVDTIKITDSKKQTTNIKFTENYKKNKIYTLKNLYKIGNGVKADQVPHIANINLDNILNFEFTGKRNDVTDTKMSTEDLKKAFLTAVNTNLVPEGWLDNHLKLILWKLLSYEIKYRNFLCTVQNVIDQLKYRYDKELYNTERPVLRKILERDNVPTKSMILCVAGIYIDGFSVSSVTNTQNVELLLTDGWYFIKANIDKMLTKLVQESRIAIGCKIITCGAELANCEQGMAPWEDTSAVRLKIFGNSTRPAPWDAVLGYSRAAILNQLSTVKVDGGKIARLRAFVTRVYPLLYVEKFEDGSTVTRSERLEHLHQMKYEAERELMMERIYEEVQKEFSDQESQDSEILDSGKRRYYDSGSQIAKMMKTSKDPMEFRAQLTSSQVHLLQEHTCKYRDKVLQAIQDRVQEKLTSRNVITLARGRVASLNDKMELTKGMLSIWKPNDAILDIFKEGAWIEVMNTVPTAIRYSEIQITAGRQSVFRATKSKNEVSPLLQSLKRTCFKISDVTQNPTMKTDYNEIDTVGMVFLIEPNNREFESNRHFQNVYLTDADKNIISVNFWGGVKKFGFENILYTGQVVACANLQKRAGNTGKNIPQFRVTEFSHFTKTPRNAQAREMVDGLDKKLFGLDRRKFCDDCAAIKNNYAALRCPNNNENESPYRFYKGDYSFARNKMFIDTPLGMRSNKKEDVNFNLTGLDFESSFKQDTPELSPRTLLRKKKVGEKIARLKLYGEPPPLSPINIIDKSVNAKNSYKSPLVSSNSIAVTPLPNNGDSVSNNVTQESPKAIPRDADVERSPVITVKRSYVRSVPVKLNFANDQNADHFGEEFDGSPPLSLD